ncbi:NIPSNAP family protein [Sphingomonas profundi]|uniref:NIPSNAP family protein n=1 Tax=Alterirhizorhabdus profundi TaxID=2681549 RepID=UPI0018D0EBF0|nr:NIPSNAP family protein [Sphingomonas profundi]
MIHEYRTYRLKPGALSTYLAAFESIALPLIRRHMDLIGFWSADTGLLNRVHHLWAFADHAERATRFAALRAEPDYQQRFLPVALPLIEDMTSQILLPVSFAAGLPLGAIEPRRGAG